MILTLARCSKISNLVPPLLQTVTRSLCQIIVFLFINLNQMVSQGIRHRVAITNDNHILVVNMVLHQTGDGSVASHNMNSVLQQRERYGVNREIAICQDYRVTLYHTW